MLHNIDLEHTVFNNLDNMLEDIPLSSNIGISISGGSDSVALAVLTIKWSHDNFYKQKIKRNVTLFTVNHNLREESKKEVLYVKELGKIFCCDVCILEWNKENNDSNLQARAREGRYNLITSECKIRGINNLLTGHHEDDMMETFYLRRKRKSGILGLSSSYTYFVNDIRILRPLFNVKKSDLKEYLIAKNITWYEDQSNYSLNYERNLCRLEIASLSCEEKFKLSEDIIYVNQESENICQDLIRAIAEIVQIDNLGFAVINLEKFLDVPYDIQVQILNFSLCMINGGSFPRYRLVKKILNELCKQQNFIRTLHGCVIKKKSNNILVFYREYGAICQEKIKIEEGIKWDKRFFFERKTKFSVNINFDYEVEKDFEIKGNRDIVSEKIYLGEEFNNNIWDQGFICKFSEADWNITKIDEKFYENCLFNQILTKKEKKDIIFTLPVIKILEKIVAIPHINYYCDVCCEKKFRSEIDVVFQPSFISRFTHFF